MSILRQRMKEDMAIRGLAPSTQQAYLKAVERLALVLVFGSIKSPIDVILILSPRNTSHHVNTIAMIAPGLDSLRLVNRTSFRL